MDNNILLLTGMPNSLTISDVINVAEKGFKIDLSESAKEKIVKGRKKLENQITDEATKHIPIYGTNRGCGDLLHNEITEEQINQYQIRYIKAHNCGTGNPLSIEIVRAIMLIRLNSFAKGLSGMKIETCQLMIDMLNKGITPWILEEGSVGASGDLVPLAMMSATMIGLDEAKAYVVLIEDASFNALPELKSAKEAFLSKGLKHITLGAKEAMGLTNGSNFISGIMAVAVRDAERVLKTASISTALSLEAIRGEKRAFQPLINEMSERHDGQIYIARQIRSLLEGSNRTTKEAQEYVAFVLNKKEQAKMKNEERVQDRYSFRCAPQIHGATYEAIHKLKNTLEKEINSATDNPLFDFDNDVELPGLNGEKIKSLNFASGGNFHGQLLASPIDYMKLALTSLGLVTDKRTFSLLSVNLSFGLPQDLAVQDKQGKNIGGNSGYMIAQYAGAARAAENRVLSTPASVMSISTAANQEDYVSMGSIGALHCRKIIYNCQILIAIELLCATRALQLTYDNLPEGLKELGVGTQKIFEKLTHMLGPYTGDNYIRTELEKIIAAVKSGELIEIVEPHSK